MNDKVTDESLRVTEIPEGFHEVSADGLHPFHDFRVQPVLVGKVTRIRGGTVGKGARKRDTRFMDIDDGERISTVGERVGLRGFFDTARVGDTVMIAFEGSRKLPGEPNPMHVFRTAIRDTEDDDDNNGGRRG